MEVLCLRSPATKDKISFLEYCFGCISHLLCRCSAYGPDVVYLVKYGSVKGRVGVLVES